MNVSSSGLPLAALALGLGNHLYWKRYERESTTLMLVFTSLLPQPVILALVTSSFNLKGILVSCAYFTLSLLASILVYRLSPFHPLADVPGPVVARITKLWSFYIASTGNMPRVLKRLHDKYGSIVRIGPNEISIVDSEAVEAVYGQNGLPKGKFYSIRTDPHNPTNLLFMTGPPHARRRQRWNRALGMEAVKYYEEVISRQTNKLLDKLQEELSAGEIDISRKFGHFTFDIMGEVSFGQKFETLKTNDSHRYVQSVLDFSEKVNVLAWLPWAFHVMGLIPSIAKARGRLVAFSRECAGLRVTSGASVKDIWYHLMDEADREQEKPSIPEVVADGILAIIAGSDTSASAMASVIWFVLRHPECYQILQKEVDAIFADGENFLDSSRHKELSYLSACISEALRLHPPNATNGPREVPYGSGGRTILGRYLPEGTQVLVPPYVVHRNPKNFSSPEKFLPSRWMRNLDANFVHKPEAFIPFSYGPASCVGRALALKEMLFALSSLFFKFELQFAPGFDYEGWERTRKDYFISPSGPLALVLRERH
ncbi:hypothetical protein VKT23_014710 [Stygiomarasmius scandens]|uniref:Cytochrome P450 n=1 Tax=Marasmiellus scandens TaxID=2682957 RepID=A0ABR1J240_9AGAR